MLRARQSSYVINNVDVGKTDLGNTVGYEECLDYVEKDDYDQIPADRDTINHDYLVLTSTVKEEMKQTNNMVHHQNKQSDSEVHQTKQSLLRPIFLIMLCIIITASVTAIVTFFATKQVLSETNEKCDYLAVNYYRMGACKVCIYSFPDCVGFADGIHRNEYISQSSKKQKSSTDKMLRARQSSYVINNVDVGKTDLGNTVGYEECLDYVEKDDYDQIPADRDTINHDYLVLTSTVKEEMKQTNNMVHHQNKQSDSEVHQTKQSLLRPIFLIMLCIIITASVTAIVTFFATKQVLSETNEKYKADATRCNTTCCNSTGDASCTVPCSQESCENGGTCVNDDCMCDDGFAGVKCEIDVNQTCKSDANRLIPHPNTCQLYYNCSQAVSPIPTWYRLYTHIPQVLRPAYLHECPYPELFSTTTMSCQNYTDVKCGSRYETKNKCDYLAVNYYCMGACKVCIYSFPDCVGFADGIHRNEYISQSSRYFECQNERIIYGGQNPCPSNMAPDNGKCTDLFEIQHEQHSIWQLGYAIDCSGRPNGNYKSEHIQKCDIYYTCVNGNSTLTYCDSELVFDSKSSFCQNTTNVCTPCGSVVSGC